MTLILVEDDWTDEWLDLKWYKQKPVYVPTV
jgi:hypothetical protein